MALTTGGKKEDPGKKRGVHVAKDFKNGFWFSKMVNYERKLKQRL